ncbi:hypothetical protein N5D61_24575 [Pseudomonas sp. GD03842]|uniref:hypothetical protein n=1 Tax=Pseudomonas sp. GD03842 TaxID=2975385 RepID=UPI002449AB5E|nr:hypothetical protein [Pseudomonas sp. GD03842]MDH0749504.1 hypothetical protein [Pseudomonas sp. GD03842]
MNVDIQKLKMLAEAATKCSGQTRVETDYNGVHQIIGDGSWKILNAWHTPDGKGMQNAQFAAAANPAAVLELISEIERLQENANIRAVMSLRADVKDLIAKKYLADQAVIETSAQRDQVKAENAILRKALTTIREESSDLGACECAADALVDSRKEHPAMTSQDKFIAWAEKNMPTLHLERSEVSGHFVSPVTGNIFIGWSARDGEVEALRNALTEVMAQVDCNIRETVRDCVNGRDDVQDIYGYCDTIEEVIYAAMSNGGDQ